MLDRVFMQILDMSKTGSIVILVVLFARLLLKKAPKAISYALWAVVLFRLLCPFSIEAPVSIVPPIASVAEDYTLEDQPISFAGAGVAAYQAIGDALNGGLGVQHIPTTNTDEAGNVEYVTASWYEVWILFGKYLWLAGVAGMILYSVVSYCKLKKKLTVKVLLRDNIYIADDIGSPFVIGLVKPKIYLPPTLSEKEEAYIVAHERHHIQRFDHVIKFLAYCALVLHWMNPLVWVAFILANRDMEMSCDEAVIRKFGEDVRGDYAASLLSLATGKRIIAGTPLAFGEGDPKERIKNLAKWKKPILWVTVLAAVLCAVLAVCLLTDAAKDDSVEEQIWYDGTVSDRAMSVIKEGSLVSMPYLSIVQDDGIEIQFWVAKGYDVPEGIAIGDRVKVLGSVEVKTGWMIAHQVEPLDPDTDDEEQKYREQWEELKREEQRLRQQAEADKAGTKVPDRHHTEPDHNEDCTDTHHH